MMRRLRSLLLLAVIVAAAGGSPATPDPHLVERILAETEVVDRPERPSASDYLGHVTRSLFSAPATRAGFGLLARGTGILLWLLAGLGALAFIGFLWLLLRPRRRAVMEESVAPGTAVAGEPVERPRSAAQWRQLVESCLAAADLAGALRALWWWTAVTAAGGGAEPSWTSADAARAIHRPELRSLLLRLDRMAFGVVPPEGRQIRSILSEADHLLS